jgi:MoxR-like ATPase
MNSQSSDIELATRLCETAGLIKAELAKKIVGQHAVIDDLLACFLSGGHCLLIGVPGLAKTMLVSSLAQCLDLAFNRIQFTPDLMPSDITGSEILVDDRSTGRREFRFVKGPVFHNIVLADEINRTPPKTQSALLQTMQEREVTTGGTTYPLPDPFWVLATQNPIEQEGTYPLPEAQIDRFMLKISIGYPNKDEELEIMRRMTKKQIPRVNPVVSPKEIVKAREVVQDIYIDEKIERYIVDMVFATRNPKEYDLAELVDLIEYGASPRASIYLAMAAKAHAFLRHRGYVTPEDVRSIGMDVLRHRIIVTYEAEAEEVTAEDVVRKIINKIEVP